jgi:hypothetical protein
MTPPDLPVVSDLDAARGEAVAATAMLAGLLKVLIAREHVAPAVAGLATEAALHSLEQSLDRLGRAQVPSDAVRYARARLGTMLQDASRGPQ